MNLPETLQKLYAEKERVQRAIAILEGLQGQKGKVQAVLKAATAKRRGRKFMAAAERRQVSARMKRYWANRREEKTKPD